jgi:hypothetical protein
MLSFPQTEREKNRKKKEGKRKIIWASVVKCKVRYPLNRAPKRAKEMPEKVNREEGNKGGKGE